MSIVFVAVFAPFDYPFVQRGLVEVCVLAVASGILGTWIVLRGLAFFAHAVGTAAFPGLVLADGLGFSAGVGAFAAAAVFALGIELLAGDRRQGRDSLTALVLVGALALGVILASDVFHSGAEVETLLFGSLLLVGQSDIVFAAVVGLAVLCATLLVGRRWLAAGFDEESARAIMGRTGWSDAALVLLVAVAVTAALSAVGALLVSALFVVPAATTRLWLRRLVSWQVATVLLALAEGVVGLWVSVQLNVPPGAAIAVLAGGVFAVAGAARLIPARRLVAVASVVLGVSVLAGCGATGGSGGGGPSAVATTTQIGDWVRTVGGRDVDVHQILRPNTDPHEYEPRPADVVAAAGGNLVFENGDRLDRWMGKVVSEAGGRPKVVVLADAVPVRLPGEAAGPEASRYDAHWWHDPRNAEAAVAAI